MISLPGIFLCSLQIAFSITNDIYNYYNNNFKKEEKQNTFKKEKKMIGKLLYHLT